MRCRYILFIFHLPFPIPFPFPNLFPNPPTKHSVSKICATRQRPESIWYNRKIKSKEKHFQLTNLCGKYYFLIRDGEQFPLIFSTKNHTNITMLPPPLHHLHHFLNLQPNIRKYRNNIFERSINNGKQIGIPMRVFITQEYTIQNVGLKRESFSSV